MKRSLPNLMLITLSSLMLGLGSVKHSTVKTAFTFSKTDTDQVTVTFQVVPNDNLKANFNGPWLLEVQDAGTLVMPQAKWDRSQLNESLPGFKWAAKVPAGQEAGSLRYRLVSFICTADKQVCYRDVHQGEAAWRRDS